MIKMVIVGTAAKYEWGSDESLRLYRLDKKVIKDVPMGSLAEVHPAHGIPVHEVLGVVNYADFTDVAIKALYPKYITSGGLSGSPSKISSNSDACFVLGAHGLGGYVCLRPHAGDDYIRVMPRSRLVQDAKKGRLKLINAVIEQIDGHDTISPITGEWEDMSYLTGRTLVEGSEQEAAGLAPDKRDKIAAGDSVTSHDELGMLNSEQKEFLKDYYIDYSVEAFNRIAGQTAWKLKEGKTAKLVELRKIAGGEDWRFAGLWDGGFFGAAKCEFGHKLRYVYMACPVSQNFITATKAGTLLKFGIVCHADFLEIPREDVARLGKLQDTMCDEIAFISTAVANNSVEKHNVLMSSLITLLTRLAANNKLEEILGDRLFAANTGFVAHNLPLVESYVLDVQRKLEDYGTLQVLQAAGYDTSDFLPTASPLYEIPKLAADASMSEKKQYAARVKSAHQDGLSAVSRANESYFTALMRYADMFISNDICGEYMYVPTHEVTEFRKRNAEKYKRYDRNDVALRYNEETRDTRKYWMEYFARHTLDRTYMPTTNGLKCPYLCLDGLERFMQFARRVQIVGKNIENAVGQDIVSVIDSRFSDMYSVGTGTIDAIYPKMLMLVLPFNSSAKHSVYLRRRAVNYVKSSKEVYDMMDATADGTDPAYIQVVKDYFTPYLPKPEPEAVPVQGMDSFLAEVKAERELEQVAVDAVHRGTAQAMQNMQVPAPQAPQAAPTQAAPQQNRRGDPAEAKKMTADFEELYNKIKAVERKDGEYLGEPTIKIATDIIARFRDKLKEKEGFTRQEKWRVDNETKRLQLVENQLKRNGTL